MSFLSDLLKPRPPVPPADPLYRSVVAEARRPDWFIAGEVEDTLDGRFDMLALILVLVLRRLDQDDERQLSIELTERFIDDMDSSLREIGIGDMVIGKHVGRMMGALGGRLNAYGQALEPGAAAGALSAALRRNLYRLRPVSDGAVDWVERRVRMLALQVDAAPLADLAAGRVAFG